MTDKLWYFNVVGSAGLDRLLTVFLYASKRYAIRHFVIDSLTCGLMSTRWGWWAGGWICTRWQMRHGVAFVCQNRSPTCPGLGTGMASGWALRFLLTL